MTIQNDLVHQDERRKRYNLVRVRAAYTAKPDDLVACQTSAGAIVITLPAAPSAGACVAVGDDSGAAATNVITVAAAATIDGAASISLSRANELAEFIYDGSMYRRVLSRRLVAAQARDLEVIQLVELANALPSTAGVLYGAYATRPTAGVAGRMFIPSDGPVRFVDTGTEWRPLLANSCPGKQPGLAATWTLVTAQGLAGTTLTDQAGRVALLWTTNAGGVAEPFRFAYRAAPAIGATGYRVTMHLTAFFPTNLNASSSYVVGVGWRLSTTGSIEVHEWNYKTNGAATSMNLIELMRRYTASNTSAAPVFAFSSQIVGFGGLGSMPYQICDLWFRLERNPAGDRRLFLSPDNVDAHYREITQAGSLANAFFAPDEILFECSNFGDITPAPTKIQGCYLNSYEEAAL